MPNLAHISFRLSAQRALLTHVTPLLRSVSLAVDESCRCWAIRFIFDGSPTTSVLEAAQCAVTEIVADFPDWEYSDEFLVCPAPMKMQHLDWLVYHRCEDELVEPRA
ncbi:MAG TPA: hypothetical protein VFA18_09175 [Gemmataceae bacterium]|nr:hypothetical protein [Gemmataceae bacterium]